MNESIGVKGGKNDRKRTLKNKKKKEEKLKEIKEQEKIVELEKKVRKKQAFTLIKTLPIVFVGGTVKSLFDTDTYKYDNDKNTNDDLKEKEKENTGEKFIIDYAGKKIVVKNYFLKKRKEEKDKNKEIMDNSTNDDKKDNVEEQNKDKSNDKENEREKEKDSTFLFTPKNYSVNKNKEEEKDRSKKKVGVTTRNVEISLNDLDKENYEKLSKLKVNRIIQEYEKQLKDIRYELKQIVFEYAVLEAEEDEIIFSEQAAVLLDKLNDIIWRIEVLKEKLKIEDLDKYDDNYIYTLIEEYLREFKDGRFVDEIKDSALYIMIEAKLEELSGIKDSFSKRLEDKQSELMLKEDEFEKLKNKYYSIEKINKELLAFQNEQDAILKEVREKVANAVTVSERVEVQVEAMNKQSKKLLALMALSLLVPGKKATKGFLASIAAYMYFASNIMKPEAKTRKYRVITVKDYSNEINDSLESIDYISGLLGKTSDQIDKMIKQINNEFGEYIGVFKECDELISNLEKVKSEILDKEYEINKIREQQELVLSENNSKVLTRGEFLM